MEKVDKWIVVNVTRGLIDGHYFEPAIAARSARLWSERCPGDYILMCNAIGQFGTPHIPDDVFMARALRGADK